MTAKEKCSRTADKQGSRASKGHCSRLLAVALCLSLLLGLIPLMPAVKARAEVIDSGTCGDNLTWELDDNGLLTISGSGAIFNYSFWMNNDFTTVVINEGVTSIGDYAFAYCQNLTSVYVNSDEIPSLGDYAFEATSDDLHIYVPTDKVDEYKTAWSEYKDQIQAYNIVILGDVNGDSSINAKDVTILRRYLASGWNVTICSANSDVNRDGTINAKDVTILRRYLASGWGVVLN